MVKFDQTYRKEVNITQPYIQGETEDEVRRKYHLDKVVKLGSNENPYAPYYHSKNAMIHSISTLNRYPEDDFVNMKKLLADETGLKPETLLWEVAPAISLKPSPRCLSTKAMKFSLPSSRTGCIVRFPN